MANVVTTNYFREQLSKKEISLTADTYKVALMNDYVNASSESTLKAVSAWGDVSAYEVSANGYSAQTITSPVVSSNGNVVYWNGANITWNNITVTTYGFAIYRTSDNLVLGFVEFTNAPIIAVNGSITINWNPAGIANII